MNMSLKKLAIFTAIVIILLQNHMVFAFTIINQTDSEKVLIIQEAYRPQAVKSGDLSSPEPIGEPLEITVPAKNFSYFDLPEPCSVLLISVKTIEVTTTSEGKIRTTTSTTTSCYEPYNHNGQKANLINDEWGIVIHNPLEKPNLGNILSKDYFIKQFLWQQTKKQGYGIKCLHPLLLAQIDSLDALPEELNR